MKTRIDLLNGECTHREYYAQFVTENIKKSVANRLPKEKLVKAILKDPNLNSIPLAVWDGIGVTVNNSNINTLHREAGDWTTKVGLVCIVKEAARQIIES